MFREDARLMKANLGSLEKTFLQGHCVCCAFRLVDGASALPFNFQGPTVMAIVITARFGWHLAHGLAGDSASRISIVVPP